MNKKEQIKNEMKPKVKSKYKYKLREPIVYLGNLYEGYRDQIATIISRKTKKQFYIWYLIEFKDGFQQEVKEEWITSVQYEMEGS